MEIPTIRCSSATDLLRKLEPDVTLPRGRRRRAAYRGQADSGLGLSPTALRGEMPDGTEQRVIESYILRNFASECLRSGLPLPEDSRRLRRQLLVFRDWNKEIQARRSWPLPDHWGLWALAQHHGLPTRCLDWSLSFVVAAYFAAQQVVREFDTFAEFEQEVPGGDLVVWKYSPRKAVQDALASIKLVQHLPSPSPNVTPQQSLFTVHCVVPDPERALESQFSDKLCLRELVTGLEASEFPVLEQYLLEKRYAPALLELCGHYNVTGATMFPGYSGAAASVLDKIAALDLSLAAQDEGEEEDI